MQVVKGRSSEEIKQKLKVPGKLSPERVLHYDNPLSEEEFGLHLDSNPESKIRAPLQIEKQNWRKKYSNIEHHWAISTPPKR